MDEHDRQAAPGALELVRCFANTLDVEEGTDALSTPAELHAWLTEHDLRPDAPSEEADLAIARDLRAALRSLLAANGAGADADPDALAVLEQVGEQADLGVRFGDTEGCAVVPRAGGTIGSLGRLVAVVADAMRDGEWARLKACRNDECAWVFFDHSRNRSGRWCTMAVCGNRAKVAAHRARSADDGSDEPT